MIKYYAVYDISRESYCTDLIPCDDDVIAIRWFVGYIRNSNYALTCPRKQDLVLHALAYWDSTKIPTEAIKSCFETITIGDSDTIAVDYNKAISAHAARIDNESDIPDIKPMSDGDYRRMIELSKRKVVKDE